MPERLLDDFLEYLVRRADQASLWLHFTLTLTYNLICRPEVSRKITIGQLFMPCSDSNDYYFMVNSDNEKTCKFR
eukprot:CAMPEP_0204822162 /NCGR_PEP_ID=MMETSP1346-20131115/336_1 /ASSEMBLY_ACC=CAM_ASM_000771 /TAXON_ID=215587 /ORGANISM="Aplanochytrium stocchinoi, Strain GSBS06" /LENGTH=74 /DNA_ID=CAMNT_0051948221 /DNA_START=402 /DNA_END=626 /DNA_ORIENTATION=+